GQIPLNLTALILPIAVVVLIAAGGYVINDYYDAEIDLINKPFRPIPSGRVSKVEALILSLILMSLGIAFSYYVGLISFTYAVFNAVLLILYSRRL
ncbi:UbiA family prenyltransferase, partial [Escherichia coli]|uniref:UbiA family prenyltransferase n=1 Tax=Escherichia coli TaxID=562 RepID=UPI0012C4C299